jgi:hypothetical protein
MTIIVPKRLKQTLINMKQRCYNLKATSYEYYGGKGVTICDEWLNDKNKFYDWAMNNGYKDDLTIDRKEVDGNYEPDNCRWVTLIVQANNKTNNVFIEHDGEVKTIAQWSQDAGIWWLTIKRRLENGKDILENKHAVEININNQIKTMKQLSEESGIPYNTIAQRHNYGWNDSNLTKEVVPNEVKYIEINGEIHTASEWADISGLSKETILMRIQYGWKNEDLLKPKKKNRKKKYIEIDGISHTIDEWCKIAGIHRSSFYTRIKKGLTGKDLITFNKTIS